MATIGNSFIGLIDHYTRTNRLGNVGPVIEALHQLNPLMLDAYMVECNNGSNHETLIRTGLGTGAWGRLYQGIVQSKSTTQKVQDTTGFVERLSTIDTRYLDLVKDPAGERMVEATASLEWIAQEVQANFFYADTQTTPERFKGLAARYGSISGGGAAASQIVDVGGTGSANTSIWMVTWGPAQTRLIYPEGSTGGIRREDKGEVRVYDDNNLPYYAKEELFTQHVGVSVGDWRFNVRAANIDITALRAGTVNVFDILRKMRYANQNRRNARIQNDGMVQSGKTVIYMNRDVMQAMEAQSTNRGSSDNYVRLTPDELAGKEIMVYHDMPIRETDALINAEARVV
jgi:hypothetical protein